MEDNQDSTDQSNIQISFAQKPASYFPADYFSPEWADSMIRGFSIDKPLVGIQNLGNTCFMCTVLECLAYSAGLPYFAMHLPNIIFEKNMGVVLFLYHFGQLCRDLWETSSHKPISPYVFYDDLQIICPDMKPGIQQDAHEFLISLLNRFDDECIQIFDLSQPITNTAIHCLFGSQICETHTCSNCGKQSVLTSRFLDLTLNIDYDFIDECLDSIFPNINLPEYQCENCKSVGFCNKRCTLAEPPFNLIIHIIRFTALGQKIEKRIEFDREINLTKYSNGNPCIYDLYAVIVHSGHEISHGHYTCYVKTHTGQWVYVDDGKVQQVSLKVVLKSLPYILFYKRRDERLLKPVLVQFGLPDEDEPSAV